MTILALKNNLLKIFCYLFIFTILLYSNMLISINPAQAVPKPSFTVVLDAGHGGIDTGCTGVNTGITESEITLKITNKVQGYLTALGINVVQTRTNMDGLYGTFASGFKMRDLEKRKQIILNSNADLVVSIHLNSFTDATAHGAQVFYKIDNMVSKNLAQDIQSLFLKNLYKARSTAQKGDFYILNCTDVSGILIECGFLSNPEEEKLLTSNDYLQKISYNISIGILNFFNLVKF